MKYLGYIFVALVALASCKPQMPHDVLSESDMVDILYDIHVAQAMSDVGSVMKDRSEIIALRASVLAKHDVTQEEWDHSYIFYCGHANYLAEIYQQLSDRMNESVEALGGQVEGITEGDAADTANIWRQENYCILMQQSPYDKMTFTIIPDTNSVKAGDRINLQYDSQLLFQDGMRDITVSLNLYYGNDSIVTRTQHITTNGRGILSISNDVDRLKIKKISGFFLMTQQISSDPSSHGSIPVFRLAIIRNIKLLHFHTEAPAKPAEHTPRVKHDSLDNDRSKDTRLRP